MTKELLLLYVCTCLSPCPTRVPFNCIYLYHQGTYVKEIEEHFPNKVLTIYNEMLWIEKTDYKKVNYFNECMGLAHENAIIYTKYFELGYIYVCVCVKIWCYGSQSVPKPKQINWREVTPFVFSLSLKNAVYILLLGMLWSPAVRGTSLWDN